jgi:hypothetical protein
MNLREVAAELSHEDGRTDMTKLVVAFRNFANAPKRGFILHTHKHYVIAALDV